MRLFLVLSHCAMIALGSVGLASGSELPCCATEYPLEVLTDPSDPLVEARVVFLAFQDGDSTLPAWASELEGDIPAYVRTIAGSTMVGEQVLPLQDMNLEIVRRPGPASSLAWVAPNTLSYYITPGSGETLPELNSQILTDIAYEYYEAYDGMLVWSGVEFVFLIYYGCPLSPDDLPNCLQAEGRVGISLATPVPTLNAGGTTQQMEPHHDKQSQEAIMLHEYFHTIRLLHPPDGVHYGHYDIMAGTQDDESALVEGLVPVHPLELSRLETQWAPQPTLITDSALDLIVPDFFGCQLRADRRSYIVMPPDPPSGTSQGFFFVNHQGRTLYDAKYLGKGLLVWHIVNGNGPARDLELASGKFTGLNIDPIAGSDALENHTPENPYLGSAADFFDGAVDTAFSYNTNPNSNFYEAGGFGTDQSITTDFALENIRQQTNGDIWVDVYLTRAQLVTSPTGTVVAARGDTIEVRWRERAVLEYPTVDIEISEDGGQNYRIIGSGCPNDGAYKWYVLQKPGNYKLRVVSCDGSGERYADEADATFSIEDNRVCSP